MDAVQISGVTKTFGEVTAVNDLSLTVPEASVFGFIGPNGSGKTTTIRMIVNIFYPDRGEIRVFGQPLSGPGGCPIGYLPEERGLYRKMNVRPLLEFFGELRGGRNVRMEVDTWLERLDLARWAERRVDTLSKGMSQRVQFIAAVVPEPKLLILDEPFTGLDPVSSDAVRDAILGLRRRGATVILSTHDMTVAETMFDQIFMIFKGRKVLDGTLASIQDQYGTDTLRISVPGGLAAAGPLPGVEKVRDLGQVQELRMARGSDPQELSDQLSLLARDEATGVVRQAKKKDPVEDAVPFVLVILLTMIVMIGAAPMLPAVTEDKNQRIFEMLLGLATPMELMAARVLAALGRSLTSCAFYIFGAVLVLQGMSMMGVVPFQLLPWFVIYLVAHVTMLCSFAAALGAACNSPQDAQNLAVVLVAPIMNPIFLLVAVMTSPNGALATALSLFPPFTPVLMLMRQAMPVPVPGWQPWVGLAGVILWTLAVTWIAARIFRVGILMQGQSPKLSDLMRLAWAG